MNEKEHAALVDSLNQQLGAGATLAEAASKIREQTPDLSASRLAQALAATLYSSGLQASVHQGRKLLAVDDPVNDAIQIAAALKAAGYTLIEIAPAIVDPGVYPNLTAFQLGTVLLSPSVYPETKEAEMRAALQAANFSQADIDSAIAQLFPTPVAGVITDGAVLNFHCLGNIINPAHTWLDGRTQNGSVGLAPTTADPFTGTKWKAHAQGKNVFAFQCLGAIVNPAYTWLDGRTVNGTVGLAPTTSDPFTGTKWEVADQGEDTYTLKCLGNIVNPAHTWLDGRTQDGSVGLAPTTAAPFTGTKWKATLSKQYRKIGPQGVAATPFDDTDAALQLNQPLTMIRVHHGEILDSIQAFYGEAKTAFPIHGGEGGGSTDIILVPPGDYITKVSGFYGGWLGGRFMLQLTFQTKQGKTYGPYGTMWNAYNQTPFSLEANANEKVIAFFGQASLAPGTVGGYLCSLGLTVQEI